MKYKVGDKVRVTSEYFKVHWDKVYKIIEIDNSIHFCYRLIGDNKETDIFAENELELAEEEKVMYFIILNNYYNDKEEYGYHVVDRVFDSYEDAAAWLPNLQKDYIELEDEDIYIVETKSTFRAKVSYTFEKVE